MADATTWIDRLELEPHPEGGYYKRTYRSAVSVAGDELPNHHGDRPTATAIYYLLEADDYSAFHRLASDELWQFHHGSPLTLYLLGDCLTQIELGRDRFQAVIPAGTWFGAEITTDEGFALVGCVVTPGFDFEEFELAGPELTEKYPAHREIIDRLT